MRIQRLELLAADLSAQRDFYARVLGLPICEDHAERLAVGNDAWRLVFTSAPSDWRGSYHVAFNIPENQFDAARRWLGARVPLIRGPNGTATFFFEDWSAHAVYFSDPAGNILELIARHSLAHSASSLFSSRGLLSISEVGVATEDVLATVQALQTQLNAPVYRGASSPDFTAVGDEEGLLIVVRRGRLWFASEDLPAEVLPTRMTVATPDGRSHTLVGPPWLIARSSVPARDAPPGL